MVYNTKRMSNLQQKLQALKDAVVLESDSLMPLQMRIIENELHNIEQALGAKDTFVSIGDTKFLMWEYTMRSATKQIRAIATNRGSKSGHGFSKNQKLMDVQEDVIKNGVQIHRAFCVDEDQYEDFTFMELIRSQLDIGIHAWVARNNAADFLTSEYEYDQENYVIADDTILYRSYVENGIAKNSVSFDKVAIIRYIQMHEKLLGFATEFSTQDLPKRFDEM